MGRQAQGPSKKKACDTRRDCKKKKQSEGEAKAQIGSLKHPRAF